MAPHAPLGGFAPAVPFPLVMRVRVWVGAKFAVTDFAASMVTVQSPVPVQAPDQPVKTELMAGL